MRRLDVVLLLILSIYSLSHPLAIFCTHFLVTMEPLLTPAGLCHTAGDKPCVGFISLIADRVRAAHRRWNVLQSRIRIRSPPLLEQRITSPLSA